MLLGTIVFRTCVTAMTAPPRTEAYQVPKSTECPDFIAASLTTLTFHSIVMQGDGYFAIYTLPELEYSYVDLPEVTGYKAPYVKRPQAFYARSTC